VAPLAQLVTVTATDGLLLPALLFEPARPTARIVIWLHGMGTSGVIYSPDHTNAIASALTATGTAFLALQNRGAGILQGIKYFDEAGERQKRIQGTSHELIRDCIHDVEGALAFAGHKGYTDYLLGGHSTGANKTALYNYLKPENAFSGYIIYGGGDDTGIFYEDLGSERFHQVLATSKRQIDAGHGEHMAPTELFEGHFSYQSIYDLLGPDGDYNVFPFYEAQHARLGSKLLFREFKSITKPALVVYGAADEYCRPDVATCLSLLARECSDPKLFTFQTIPGADHGCYQHEPELGGTIAKWVQNHHGI
jgi:pimeloyl-ACP methyl ester carboxylesterase